MTKDRKVEDFANLVQGSMSVTEYKTKFDEVSKYAPNLIAAEADKKQKFQRGLNQEIRWRIPLLALEIVC